MISLLITLLILFAIAWGAHYVISSFFPEPMRTIAYIIVGIILLVVLLGLLGVVDTPLRLGL